MPPQSTGPQTPPAQQPPPANPPAQPSPPPVFLGTVVIDPGHGGDDAGARGSGGVLEKDVVMNLAQLLRGALERQGFRVVMTRQANDNPSFDDRAGTANAYRGALVVTLHVSSTGAPGVARTYYSVAPGFESPTAAPPPPAADGKQEPPAPRPVGLVRWEEAQASYVEASKRLAEAVQAQVKQKLDKSPNDPAAVSLRDLRSIASPAIAVELASVSVKDRAAIDPFLQPLAEAIAQGIRAYRTGGTSSGGGK